MRAEGKVPGMKPERGRGARPDKSQRQIEKQMMRQANAGLPDEQELAA